MKLLLLTQIVDKNDPILGFFHGWILEFSKHFAEVHVICLKKGMYDLPAHVHVYSLGKETGESRLKYVVRFYRFFGHIFFKVRVNFVFFHMGAIYNILATPFFMLRKFFGTKFLWWKAHGHINWFGRFALGFCDEVITSTASGFPVKTKKRRIVGQAIDVSLFTFPEKLQERDKEVIFVGRIMPIKHIEVFIAVAKELEKDGYSFSVIGPIGDQKYFERIKSLSVDTNIQFLGSKTQKELVLLYQRAQFFLNTSLTHSMDKTVLESMLCGCVPLTANRAFNTLLNKKNLFFEKQDTFAYVAAVRSLENENVGSLREILRKDVVSEHSIDTFSVRIFGIYD